MTIIPINMSIHRNQETGKKVYKHLHTKKVLDRALMPKDWQNSTEYADLTYKQTNSYMIRPDEDLIVIDCDNLETTELIEDLLVPSDTNIDHYIVVSDKGEKHFYFEPTEYYRKSKLFSTTRVAIGKIDVLHGKSLVFAPCAENETKQVFQGTPAPNSKLGYALTPIPDNIVDALVLQVKEKTLAKEDDYKPVTSFLAPLIEQALTLYTHHTKGGNYLDMQPLMTLITPAQYREELKPDNNPARLENGRMNYLHAISFKISNDPSISFELHCELITTISNMLQRPMDSKRLKAEIFDYVRKEVNGTRWQYDPNATVQPLVSMNGSEYCPVYRTLKDEYILSKPSGAIVKLESTQKFKQAMATKNFSLLVNGQKVNLDTNIAMKKLQESMETLSVTSLPYKPTGVFMEDNSLYYNEYVPTKYLGIIRGEYKSELEYKGPDSHPLITKIIKNVMYDNLLLESKPGESMYDKFIQFLAHKLKKLEYSPLVFQLMGKRGIGKSMLMQIFEMLTGLFMPVNFSIKTEFNGDIAGQIFLNEDEGLVTQQLVNTAKTLSGSKIVSIRKLYAEKEKQRNIATYIFTTNKTTPMAETITDRRFVTFSSFKADMLTEKDMEITVALELEAFALCLRETKLSNTKLYLDANQWHDEIHFANFNEKQQTTQHVPSKIANLVFTLGNLTGEEIHKNLVDCFGYNYHYTITKKAPTTINIPLSKHPQLIRKSDNAELTHEITREQLKAVELDSYISLDKNGKKTIYGENYYRLKLTLSNTQMVDWQAAVEGIEEIKEDLGDVTI